MVNSTKVRRRLSVRDRREQLVRVSVELIATRPWDGMTVSDIAAAAEVSKPLLYHYFSTKDDLYIAAVRAAADDLRRATIPDEALQPRARLRQALKAHVDWIEQNALAYRVVLHGGTSAHHAVQAIVERSRADTIRHIVRSFGLDQPPPELRIALRGWIGFLEGACLDWLAKPNVPKARLVELLAASLPAVIAASDL